MPDLVHFTQIRQVNYTLYGNFQFLEESKFFFFLSGENQVFACGFYFIHFVDLTIRAISCTSGNTIIALHRLLKERRSGRWTLLSCVVNRP